MTPEDRALAEQQVEHLRRLISNEEARGPVSRPWLPTDLDANGYPRPNPAGEHARRLKVLRQMLADAEAALRRVDPVLLAVERAWLSSDYVPRQPSPTGPDKT